MDHSLEESLSLEGMDFDHSEDVVNQEDIPLEEHDRLGSITMDMGHVVEQPLMESGNEEVIVSDLIEDPFPFQEYIVQNNDASSSHITIDPNQLNQYNVQNESAVSFQYTDNLGKAPASTNVITIKPLAQKTGKRPLASAPRQVAIAPKPTPKPVQYAIAPRPVTLIANKTGQNIKKIPISSDSRNKGGTVLAQIGKQLVMMPKKIKLVPSTSSEPGVQYVLPSEQVQLVGSKGNKPMYKFIQLPAQPKPDQPGQPTVISKLVPATSPKAKYVMQQKTVPISIGQNLVVQNFKVAGKKQQMISIKPQETKIVAASQGNVATKQVVITSNPNQRVIYRTSAPTSSSTVVKDVISTGQRTQFHPINVPGKGIQYIKLVTNQPAQGPAQKQGTKAVPSKNFIFTDSKGNVIKMTAEKVRSNNPPPLVVSTAASKGVVAKPQKKLVRIAPVPKSIQSISQPARSSQSLLAPFATITPVSDAPASLPTITAVTTVNPVTPVTTDVQDVTETAVSLEEFNEMVEQNNLSNYAETTEYQDGSVLEETVEEVVSMDQYVDVKPSLQTLYSDASSLDNVPVAEQEMDIMHEVDNIHTEIDIKQDIRNASFMMKNDSVEDTSNTSMVNTEDSVIIVPGTYSDMQNETMYSDESQSQHNLEESYVPPYLSVEAECVPYNMSTSPTPSDQEMQLGMRPRKACNCTKSQCLKLYCDCFANGEFCNKCNCNNCHNNLENEELRQKAIRSCLERNPNAFRPKIGKSKAGGPEIIRRHTKGCNCKRSGCLKNYCECYEAKIACTNMCKCVGCRNVEETLVRRRNAIRLREKLADPAYRPPPPEGPVKQPCSFMTSEVIEAVCQCLIAAAGEGAEPRVGADPVQDVIEEFARCLQDVITASHHTL